MTTTSSSVVALAIALALCGCGRGMSACEEAARGAMADAADYRQIGVVEEPGLTPAMTYYLIDYTVADAAGRTIHGQMHCSYMRDTGEAVAYRVEK